MDAEAKKQARGEINENDRTDVMAAGGRYPRPALELDNSYLYRNTACMLFTQRGPLMFLVCILKAQRSWTFALLF